MIVAPRDNRKGGWCDEYGRHPAVLVHSDLINTVPLAEVTQVNNCLSHGTMQLNDVPDLFFQQLNN